MIAGMKSISERILSVLRQDCRMKGDDLILVGVSGGVDSIFLLSQLNELRQPVAAAVFNHGLRPEAAEECDFVAAFCAERNIPCVRGAGDAVEVASAEGIGIEDAARKLRYRFLFENAEQLRAAAVATAHHANDQAETVLMHILRGSGIDGLCGMRPYGFLWDYSETIPLIRPLLGVSRAEILESALEKGLQWREDASNADNSYTRNRIRNDLIAKLETDYNPRLVYALCRLAENAALEKDVLDADCKAALLDINLQMQYENQDPVAAMWSRKVYESYNAGLRMRMLRTVLSRLNVDLSQIGYETLKKTDDFFINARTNQKQPISDEIKLFSEGDCADILKNINIKVSRYPQLSQGWKLAVEIKTILPEAIGYWREQARLHPEMAVLDADRLASEPYLRNIIPGERFAPYGLNGKSQKLSDFLINNKVPKEYRTDLAVAADDNGILWIPGLRAAHRCAVNEETRRIIIIHIRGQNDQ